MLPLVVIFILMVVRFLYRHRAGRCKSNRTLNGKTAIVTGASSGIGKATARDFARRGARVILACRNLEKAKQVAGDITKLTGNKEVVVRELDTSDLKSVRAFSKKVLEEEPALHILVNNAGIMGPWARQVTVDGLELTMATNHYGHFLLTNLLLKRLKDSAPSRIINVSSVAHFFAWKLKLKDMNFENRFYSSWRAYNQSKLCNVLFTRELAVKLQGTGVVANSMNPGAVGTGIFLKNKGAPTWLITIMNYTLNIVLQAAGKNCDLGAQTTIHLAVSEDVEGISGKYFEDCRETWCSWVAKDPEAARALWEISETDVNLRPGEMFYRYF